MQKQGVHLSDSKIAEIKKLLRETGVASITARAAGVSRGSVNRIAKTMRDTGELGEVITSRAEQRAAAKAVGEDVNEPYGDEVLWEAYSLVTRYGNVSAAARKQGIPDTTLRRRYNLFLQKSERGDFGTEPVIPTFRISKATSVLDADGNVEREFIQQKPARGEEFEVPADHVVKGISALVDSEGREILKWIKTKEGDLSTKGIIDALRDALAEYAGGHVPILPPDDTDDQTITVYTVVDWHIGLLAWAEETGENYDLKIAQDVILKAMAKLIGASPRSKRCIVLGLGDLLHFDGFEPITSRSGNFLDTDGRYPKVLRTAAQMVMATIDMALQRHDEVLVRMLPGNHDDRSTVALNLALDLHYQSSERVSVDPSPSRFWWYRFGKNLFGATHGDKTKMADLPLVMAADRPQDWGLTTYRRIWTGHLHHERKIEEGGVIVSCMRTPVAKDAYHSFERYRAGRSVYSETFRADGSEAATLQFNL